MTPDLPIGVTRLLAVAALADGVSLNEYIAGVLTEHVIGISARERRRELIDIRNEQQSRAMVKRLGWRNHTPEGGTRATAPTRHEEKRPAESLGK